MISRDIVKVLSMVAINSILIFGIRMKTEK